MKRKTLQPLLVNAVEMNRQCPDSFHLPPKELLDALQTGMDVKVCCNHERIWINIMRRKGDVFTGVVNSMPIFGYPERGDKIQFHADNIIDVWLDDLVEEMKIAGEL